MASKSLVVVESPAKAKTIKKYLGPGFDVKASVGHVKDLPKSTMGVDLDGDFTPHYETIRGKGKVLQEIRKAAKSAEMVYLAPDPDREGEAIAWHLASELKVPADRVKRVLFHEITKQAIQRALAEPLDLDEDKFNSQQARRILDRLVGYQISPLLWDKVRRGLSAGRVQSVAVRIIVEREREIAAFVAEEFWTVDAVFAAAEPPPFKARLFRVGDEKAERTTPEIAKRAVEAVKAGPFTVLDAQTKDRRQSPPPPFTTSRLQQDAARAFRFTAKVTMGLAQRLYEGVELGAEGQVGLITYMRTDSIRLSDDAVAAARAYIGERFGEAYLPKAPIVYRNKGRAQDAHEAIRPASLDYPPERVKPFMKPEEWKLYRLIWNRFVACQMTQAVYALTTVDIGAPEEHVFRATGTVKTFDGFTRVYEEQKGEAGEEEAVATLPNLKKGDALRLESLGAEQRFTQPPPRFTEATLVRELEEKGIGRPSTYAAIISTIQDKAYCEKVKSRFQPTELGSLVTDLLVKSFPQVFDVGFTAKMEDQLDAIEEGQIDWRKLLGEFQTSLVATLDSARSTMRNVKREEKPTDLTCPRDGAPVVIKFGKNGSFLACTNYPDCKFTAEIARDDSGAVAIREDQKTGERCPDCEDGELVFKSGRYGRFVGCSNYPACKHTRPISTGVVCPKCGEGEIIEKLSKRGKTFYSCDRYPKCDHAQWDRPIPVACRACGHPFLNEHVPKGGRGDATIVCPACKTEGQAVA